MKWVSMAEQPHASLRSPSAMPIVCWSGVKLPAIGLWSIGHVFPVMNHRLAVRQTNLGFADARGTLPARMHSAKCKAAVRTGAVFHSSG